MSDTTTTIFVYGTLLRGERNHSKLSGARFLGEVATSAGFELRDLESFPGMVKGTGSVQGELYVVSQEVLPVLDALEGHPDRFWRTTIKLVDGRVVQAYLLTDSLSRGRPVIENGDWRARSMVRG